VEGASTPQRITAHREAGSDHASEAHRLSGRCGSGAQAIKIVLALTGYIDSV
jgi:hypothetical protein